ncbi:hypothetical protein B0H11DRAFT_1915516 [Mycena galericulata]|nr:hypothetical protein B0H11DRAFT_1915516 [Mycena galericulata]
MSICIIQNCIVPPTWHPQSRRGMYRYIPLHYVVFCRYPPRSAALPNALRALFDWLRHERRETTSSLHPAAHATLGMESVAAVHAQLEADAGASMAGPIREAPGGFRLPGSCRSLKISLSLAINDGWMYSGWN